MECPKIAHVIIVNTGTFGRRRKNRRGFQCGTIVIVFGSPAKDLKYFEIPSCILLFLWRIIFVHGGRYKASRHTEGDPNRASKVFCILLVFGRYFASIIQQEQSQNYH
eukprot:scaffold44515_cov191-Amphora_coffeaeformis.AAC.2